MGNTPNIRFKGFTDDWEQRKVSELFRVTRGYVLAATQTETTKTDEKPYPVYSSQTKDKGLMGYYKDYLYEDAITWTTDGANAGTVNYRAGKFYCTNVCGVLLSNEAKANQMIAEALNNVAKGYVSYVGNPKLMNNVMADIVIQIPTQAEEREQLSSLFASLDNLITLHQRKCDETKKLKKFMLQNMFPKKDAKKPEIRFAGFTDDWEQRKLNEVAEFNPKSELPDEFEYVDLESVVGTEMISHRTETKDSAPSRAQRLAQPGDVFFQTVRPYQKNNYLFSKLDNNYVFSTGYAQMRPNIDTAFLMSFLQTDSFVKIVLDNCTGTSYPAINSNDLSNLEISLPKSFEEQKKVGKTIISIDNLITLHQRKCDELKEFKKYMLQNMFPQKG